MTFKFHCTCGQKVSATDDMIGTTAVCPRCGSGIVVELPPELAAERAAAAPHKLPPRPTTVPAAPAAPMAVVPRPVKLLAVPTAVALVLLFGLGAFLFRSHLHELAGSNMPILIGLPIGLVVASTIAAIFLRLAVRIVVRFDLAFLEAWLVSLMTGAVNLLALAPFALATSHLLPPEQGGKLVILTSSGALLVTIVAYIFLLRDAQGRPIGVGRGILVYLLQGIFLGLLAGIFAVIAALVLTFAFHRSILPVPSR